MNVANKLAPAQRPPKFEGMSTDLTGKLLLAMPTMGDERFSHAVIYMCAHGEDGAMGLMINKPVEDLKFSDLLKQLSIDTEEDVDRIKIYEGGPVELGRGFVLHSADYQGSNSTLQVEPHIGMTATLDVLEDLASGNGPQKRLLALGYSGWGPGQLEDEILANGWLTVDADPELIFGTSDEDKWEAAINKLGVDPRLLSTEAGSA